jgi:copper resistance protein D
MNKPSQLIDTLTHLPFSLVSFAKCGMVAWTSHQKSVAPSRGKAGKVLPLAGIIVLPILVLFVQSPAWSQQPMHDQHAAMSMSANEPRQEVLLSWKRESEGNHHLIGFFLILSGFFILAQAVLGNKFPIIGYVWPVCFLLSGLFVLAYSDTELWPFGPKSWIQGTLTNPEVIQHKIFAVLLLGMGVLEMGRVRGRLKAVWAAWVFPVLAVAGSLLLLFHAHHTGMHGPNHMAIMARIQAEHLSYAVTGFAIGLVKGLSEVSTRWQIVFARLWPLLIVVLGILLMGYAE